jgi:hypothetical protein
MSIPIPPERVPPIAKEINSTRMTWAALIWCVTGLFVVGMFFADDFDHKHPDHAGAIAGMGFWVVVTFALGWRQRRLACRADRAFRRATEASSTFVLAGRELLAYDTSGVPQPDASIKLSRRHATMLTALPKAELRS